MNLPYHGGRVLRTNRTVALFWDPHGHLPSSYKKGIGRYLKDVAAASGTGTNPYSITTEYSPIAYDST